MLNVDLVQGGFFTYEHVGEPVGLLYSRYALHHLPDVLKAVALARPHGSLRPGGLCRLWDVVYSFPLAEAADRPEAWCALAAPRWTGVAEELEEHVRDEHSTFSWLLEAMILRSGFAVEVDSGSEAHRREGMHHPDLGVAIEPRSAPSAPR